MLIVATQLIRIENYQYALKLKKIGAAPLGQLADIARLPMTMSYSKYEELDADAQGLRLSAEAGYDPKAALAPHLRMAQLFGERRSLERKDAVAELGHRAAGG